MTNETSYLHVIHPPTISFTGTAQEAIQAGDFVRAGDNDDAVAAQSGHDASDILISVCDANGGDDQTCVGIAMTDAASSGLVTVATNGIFVVKSDADIGAGIACQQDDTAADGNASVKATIDGEEEYTIGKTLTSASADGKYMVFLLSV